MVGVNKSKFETSSTQVEKTSIFKIWQLNFLTVFLAMEPVLANALYTTKTIYRYTSTHMCYFFFIFHMLFPRSL